MLEASVTVIGGGVVGLAVAAELAPRHRDLFVLERNARYGLETSSRSSEVIHAGLYYEPGSLKARLCVEGNRMLYALCGRTGIPHRRIEKLVVAADDQEIEALARIEAVGRANGAPLTLLSPPEIARLEPNVTARAALLSPSTGLVSAHDLMDHLHDRSKSEGATFVPNRRVVGIDRLRGGYRLAVENGDALEHITTRKVINAAGLEADTIAALAGIDVVQAGYRLLYGKGSYFSVPRSKWGLVERLIFPAGQVAGNSHSAQDLSGRLRFGPDHQYLDGRHLDYTVDEARRAPMGRIIRRYLPQIADEDLMPDQAGISPRLRRPHETFRDFVIQEESARGLDGFINLIGIDSPGLTSCLSIAKLVAALAV